MLKREKIFNYDTKDMIGIMKFDFYDGCLANSWHWRSERNDFSKEEIIELQDQVNNIVFDILGDFKVYSNEASPLVDPLQPCTAVNVFDVAFKTGG